MALGARRRATAARTYKLCSLLLQYPDDEQLRAGQTEIVDAIGALPRSPAATALTSFCEWWTQTERLTAAQHYVQTLDLDKRSGLYLTFYGEGDKRERGSALMRLKRLYRAAGLPLEVLDVQSAEVPGAYRHALVLSRPDQHVAWRGDHAPDDALALVDRLRGCFTDTPVTHA